MDGNIMELIQQFLASGMGQTAILALLGVLGVRNKEAIMAVIASILNPKKDDEVKPPVIDGDKDGEGETDKKEDEPPPRRYVIVDHCHGLLEIAAEEGHADCQKKITEVQAHLLTGKGSNHEPAA